MTGTTRSSADLDPRRRRALFRSWHRGTREMDLLFGRFADAEIGSMSATDFAQFETLLDAPDDDVFKWMTGRIAVPEEHDTPVFARLRATSNAAQA